MARPGVYMRWWVLVVASWLGFAGPASAGLGPQRDWLQVRAPHFTVMGEVPARDLRRVAQRMEQLHALLSALAPTPGDEAADVTVVVFKDRSGFRPFQPRQHGKPLDVSGYFLPGPMNYIGVLADPHADYSAAVYHEYVHLAATRTLGALPLWMHEGLAEFFSTFEPSENGATARLGAVPMHHVNRLQRELMPLTTLAAIERDSPYYVRADKSSLFYAESWALVHYLLVGKDRQYAARLPGFARAMIDGGSFEQACVDQLGVSSQALEKEVRHYLGSPVFPRYDVRLPDVTAQAGRLDAAPVAEGDAHAVLAELLLFQNRVAEAQAHLAHAIEADARQPLALERQAELAAASNRLDEAVVLARKAEEYRSTALEQAMARGAAAGGTATAGWRQAVALNPVFAEGYARLAQDLADAGTRLAEARQWQERAVALAPGRDEYGLGLGRILIMLGETTVARQLLGPIAARGGTPDLKAGARRYLAALAQIEKRAREGITTAEVAPGRKPPGH